MHTEYLDYHDQSDICEAYIAYDQSHNQNRPCVLISHAWSGQSKFERQKAEELAQLGYLGFALDNYGKGKRGNNFDENAKLMQPFLDNRKMLLNRLLAGLSAAASHPLVDKNKIAIIGYCFGGLCSLDLARSADPRLKGAVSFHGLFSAPNIGKQAPISAKVLILHGYDDPMAKPDSLQAIAQEFSEASADWQIHAYGKVVHAFTNPEANMPENGILYNENAANRSWQAMCNFLEKLFD